MTLETRQEEEMLEKVRAIDAVAIGKLHEILATVRRIDAKLNTPVAPAPAPPPAPVVETPAAPIAKPWKQPAS